MQMVFVVNKYKLLRTLLEYLESTHIVISSDLYFANW